MWHSFNSSHPGLEGVQFLVWRHALDAVGDLEYAFLSNTTNTRRRPGDLAGILLETESGDAPAFVVSVRNPAVVLDSEFAERLRRSIASLDPLGGAWSVASPHGLGRNGERLSAIYSSVTPSLSVVRAPQPILDTSPDVLVINGDYLSELRADGRSFADACVEQALLIQGYLSKRIAVYVPDMVVPLHGSLLPWGGQAMIEGLQAAFLHALGDQNIPTLFGAINLGRATSPSTSVRPADWRTYADIVDAAVEAHCLPLSLSIVTRTRFNRPHLLHRMLTSVSRARPQGGSIEVVLSTDIDRTTSQGEFRSLRKLFPELELRLQVNDAHQHSRIGNLLGGVAAATRDHVTFVDDDDYVDLMAFRDLAMVTFLGQKPLVFMANTLHEEEWVQSGGRHVLARSAVRQVYPPSGWRHMFAGVNQLPISALVVPRTTLTRRLAVFEFRHDLSEDYILTLLVLTDPDLPPIVELASTFVHISSRPGQDNTITMVERRPWVRDIALFLADLLGSAGVAGPGVWQLLRGLAEASRTPAEEATIKSLQDAVSKQRRDLQLLSREIQRLTSMLAERA